MIYGDMLRKISCKNVHPLLNYQQKSQGLLTVFIFIL